MRKSIHEQFDASAEKHCISGDGAQNKSQASELTDGQAAELRDHFSRLVPLFESMGNAMDANIAQQKELLAKFAQLNPPHSAP